jgi:hypothetical protein
MGNPHHEGFCGRIANRARSCQSTKKEKAGTKIPWEKFGSCHHWSAK